MSLNRLKLDETDQEKQTISTLSGFSGLLGSCGMMDVEHGAFGVLTDCIGL